MFSLFLQLKSAQLEWSYNWQQYTKKSESQLNSALPDYSRNDAIISEEPKSTTQSYINKKSRHQRILREHIIHLEKTTSNITNQQSILQDKILALEELINDISLNKKHSKRALVNKGIENRMTNIENRMNTFEKSVNTVEMLEQSEAALINNNEINHDNKFMTRLAKLETEQKQSSLTMFNISRQVSSFNNLHRSILELLESVETLENKVDKTVPDFRKEISQLEFNMAQTLSEIALMKEDQSNTMQSVKALSVGVSTMRDKLEMDHETLEQLNITVSLLQASNYLQNSKLHDHILKVSYFFTFYTP